jgi:hypothetical protein
MRILIQFREEIVFKLWTVTSDSTFGLQLFIIHLVLKLNKLIPKYIAENSENRAEHSEIHVENFIPNFQLLVCYCLLHQLYLAEIYDTF